MPRTDSKLQEEIARLVAARCNGLAGGFVLRRAGENEPLDESSDHDQELVVAYERTLAFEKRLATSWRKKLQKFEAVLMYYRVPKDGSYRRAAIAKVLRKCLDASSEECECISSGSLVLLLFRSEAALNDHIANFSKRLKDSLPHGTGVRYSDRHEGGVEFDRRSLEDELDLAQAEFGQALKSVLRSDALTATQAIESTRALVESANLIRTRMVDALNQILTANVGQHQDSLESNREFVHNLNELRKRHQLAFRLASDEAKRRVNVNLVGPKGSGAGYFQVVTTTASHDLLYQESEFPHLVAYDPSL